MPTGIDTGDTAWMLTATTFVLFMTLPGLAMYYSGMVTSKSVLSVAIQCFAIAAIASLIWLIVGYGLAYGESFGGLIGILQNPFFQEISETRARGTIPEILFAIFQMTFAMTAPAIIVGSYVERTKFSTVLIFSGAWSLLVYVPICHWVWGDGWLNSLGVMDFAGGFALHAAVGASALVAALVVGQRLGFPNRLSPPHNPGMTAAGAGMMWVGWFGFNGGSGFSTEAHASIAIALTHASACAAALTWIALERLIYRRTSLIGMVTGVMAGLAAITPLSGFTSPVGALLLGVSSSTVCFFAIDVVKNRFGIDDSLNVFAVHGLGGIIGLLLLPILALEILWGTGYNVPDRSILTQFGVQALGVAVSLVWAALVSFLILQFLNKFCGGVRVDPEDEIVGLDLAIHGERGYDL